MVGLRSHETPKYSPVGPFSALDGVPVRHLSGVFIQSLELDFSHWAVQQTALLWVPRMPLRLFAGRCRRPTRKNSPKPSQALKSPLLRRTSRRMGHSAKRTATEPGNWARCLGVAPFGALLCELCGRHGKSGGD